MNMFTLAKLMMDRHGIPTWGRIDPRPPGRSLSHVRSGSLFVRNVYFGDTYVLERNADWTSDCWSFSVFTNCHQIYCAYHSGLPTNLGKVPVPVFRSFQSLVSYYQASPKNALEVFYRFTDSRCFFAPLQIGKPKISGHKLCALSLVRR